MDDSRKSFVHKLFDILEDDKFKDIICWNEFGNAFTVHYPDVFSQKILPAYFKHSNFSSFVRQLNLYQFKKVKNRSAISFMHDRFLKGRTDLLDTVKRRAPEVDLNPEDRRDLRIVEMFQQIQDHKQQIKELKDDLFKEKERRHQIKTKYEELMELCRKHNLPLTHDFEVADLLPKPSHNSRMSWTSDPNSSLMSSNNVSNTNLNLYYNSMQDSMYISSPPISPERLMASNIIRNLSQEVPSPQIHIIHDQPSFDYDPEQFE